MDKVLHTIVALRRDTQEKWDAIASSYTPLKGEVCFIDTSNKGLRAKVGNGIDTFAALPFTDEYTLEQIDNVVVRGYYLNNKFYTSSTYTVECEASLHKVYIDRNSNLIYSYDGSKYNSIVDTLPTASDVVAGIMKLYEAKGNHTDGTMTQKSITNELNTKFEVEVDQDEEMAIFSISI